MGKIEDTNIIDMNIVEMRGLLKSGETTSADLTRFYLDRVKRHDGHVRSYLRTTEEIAMDMAEEPTAGLRPARRDPFSASPLV